VSTRKIRSSMLRLPIPVVALARIMALPCLPGRNSPPGSERGADVRPHKKSRPHTHSRRGKGQGRPTLRSGTIIVSVASTSHRRTTTSDYTR
jgi:hypothetical protein